MTSSEISTRSAPGAARDASDQLQPWQLFTLAALAGATTVVFVTRDGGPAVVILLSLTVFAAAFVALAAWRTFGALAGSFRATGPEVLGGRTRAALEREKALVLRSIKDLEFDRAMGKVSDKDFAEISSRLRLRAAGLLQQLDRGAGYRSEIEKELARRLASTSAPPSQEPTGAPDRVQCRCGTANDLDAKFCKACGARLGHGG